jgi:hypothetical protein
VSPGFEDNTTSIGFNPCYLCESVADLSLRTAMEKDSTTDIMKYLVPKAFFSQTGDFGVSN